MYDFGLNLAARLPQPVHPLLLARIEDVAALIRLIRQLEDALEQTGVFFPDGEGGGRVNPLVEAIGKNRERLRRAMNDLDKALPPAAAEDRDLRENAAPTEVPAADSAQQTAEPVPRETEPAPYAARPHAPMRPEDIPHPGGESNGRSGKAPPPDGYPALEPASPYAVA